MGELPQEGDLFRRGFAAVPVLFITLLIAGLGAGYFIGRATNSSPQPDNITAVVSETLKRSFGGEDGGREIRVPLEQQDDPPAVFAGSESKGDQVVPKIISPSASVKNSKSSSGSAKAKTKNSTAVSSQRSTPVTDRAGSSSVSPPAALSASVAKCDFATAGDPVGKVLVNEIAWMGSLPNYRRTGAETSADEWVELRNLTLQKVDLSGWQLTDRLGIVRAVFGPGDILEPEGFFLLEQGSDESVFGIPADHVYSGQLSDRGQRLKLFNDQCALMDDVNASSKWPGGNLVTRQTLERDRDTKGWHTSAYPGGTPRAMNTDPGQHLVGSSASTLSYLPAGQVAGVSTASQSSDNNSIILISEVQLASDASSKEEFVELFNPSGSSVALNGWYLQKKTKSAGDFSTFAPKGLFENITISARGFLVLAHSESGISAKIRTDYGLADNNTLVLKDPEGEIVDELGWGEAGDCEGNCAPNPEPGESIGRKVSGETLIHTEDNRSDFEIRVCPSPGLFEKECGGSSSTGAGTGTSSGTGTGTGTGIGTGTDSTTSTGYFDSAQYESGQAGSPQAGTGTGAGAGTGSGLGTGSGTGSGTPLRILIAAVQTTGGPGKTTNDFIKLYNSSDTAADLGGWKLRKRTQSGSESSIKEIPSGTTLPPRSYFIWANSDNGFAASLGAQISSTASISDNNSIALLTKAGVISDALAWGKDLVNPFVEGSPYPTDPAAGQVLIRKTASGQDLVDTDQNSSDFSL